MFKERVRSCTFVCDSGLLMLLIWYESYQYYRGLSTDKLSIFLYFYFQLISKFGTAT